MPDYSSILNASTMQKVHLNVLATHLKRSLVAGWCGYDQKALQDAIKLTKKHDDISGYNDILQQLKGMINWDSTSYKKGVEQLIHGVMAQVASNVVVNFPDEMKVDLAK